MNEAITIRPLNPDNEIEIQHLVALFERSTENGVLSPSVFSPRYWKCAAGRRFSALIALYDGRIVAHCGFGIDRRSSSLGTLTHAMVDPAAAELLPTLAEQFREIISAQMERKGLSSLVVLRDSGSELLERFFSSIGLQPVAHVPDHKRNIELWAMVKAAAGSDGRSLDNVPMSLRGTLTATLRSLGLKAVTRSSKENDLIAMPADEIAVEPFPVSRSGKALLFVTPSLLFSQGSNRWMPQSLAAALRRWPSASIAVKMTDASCEDMVKVLQSHGFSYSGFLPGVQGRDSLLFIPTVPFREWQFTSDADSPSGL